MDEPDLSRPESEKTQNHKLIRLAFILAAVVLGITLVFLSLLFVKELLSSKTGSVNYQECINAPGIYIDFIDTGGYYPDYGYKFRCFASKTVNVFVLFNLIAILFTIEYFFLLYALNKRDIQTTLLDRIAKLKPKENAKIQKEKFKTFLTEFKGASNKKRLSMIKIPLILILLVFVFCFGRRVVFPALQAPEILKAYPDFNAREVPFDSTIEISFSKPMNKSSVENAILASINAGRFEWVNEATVIFYPAVNYERDKSYTFNLAETKSKYGIKLGGYLKSYAFSTVANPQVELFTPDSVTLEAKTPITVIFDRPMIPLTTVWEKEIMLPPFKIEPEIAGEGRWLGTTAYQFTPSVDYNLATTYKVTVFGGIGSVDGGTMKEDFMWEFSSARPLVKGTKPVANADYTDPNGELFVVFNQEIVLNELNNYLKLYDRNNKPVAVTARNIQYNIKTPNPLLDGLYNYQNFYEEGDYIVGIKPVNPLTREMVYTLELLSGLPAKNGLNGMENNYTLNFTTAPLPKLLSTAPANGSGQVREESVINLAFNAPMDAESFKGNVFINPAPTTPPSIYGYNEVNVYFPIARSTNYQITVSGNVKDQYGVPLGSSYTFNFSTAPYDPSVSIVPNGTYFGAFNQKEYPRIVSKVINADKVNYKLYKLSKDDFIELYRRRYDYKYCQSIGGMAANTYEQCRRWNTFDTTNLPVINEWTQPYDIEKNVPTHVVTKVEASNGDRVASGMYLLELSVEGAIQKDRIAMLISNLAGVTKTSQHQVLSWVVDQNTSAASEGMSISLLSNTGNTLLSGQTNSEGIWLTTNPKVSLYSSDYTTNYLFVYGEKNGEIYFAASGWDEGISTYDFGYAYDYETRRVNNQYKIFITTDRPIYRPGQKVNFKGVVKSLRDGKYEDVRGGKVSLKLDQDNKVSIPNIDLSSYGAFEGSFVLPKGEGIPLGVHYLKAYYGAGNELVETSKSFYIEEYKRSELNLELIPEKEAYSNGENMNIKIEATYLSGEPVANEEVTWKLQYNPSSFQWEKDRAFTFANYEDEYYGYWGNQTPYDASNNLSGVLTTDNQGVATLRIPVNIYSTNSNQNALIGVYLQNEANQSITNDILIPVNKGDYNIGLKTDSYSYSSGREVKVEVVAVGHDKKEIAGVEGKVEIYKRSWATVKEKDPNDGIFYYKSIHEDKLLKTERFETNSYGYANYAFIPDEGGTYKLVVRSKDTKGNSIQSTRFIWVSGKNYNAPRLNHDRINIIPEKIDYNVGEEASFSISTPYADTYKTLITTEKDKVLNYKIVNISAENNRTSVKVEDNAVPNAFISTFVFKPYTDIKNPAEFKQGYTMINVFNPKNKINIDISTNKDKYEPKENVQLKINAKNDNGEPVAGNFSIGVVDKAIWNLTDIKPADIFKYFYGEQKIGVATFTPLTVSVDRINANTNLGSKGGSGGGGGDGGELFINIRKEFPETAYWKGSLSTDKNGNGEVEFTLPDNATTWVIDVIGSGQDNSFGNNRKEFKVTKEVLVRPIIPRFLNTNDTSKIGALFSNNSTEPVNAVLSFTSNTLRVNEPREFSIILNPGTQYKKLWSVTAQNYSGDGDITLAIRADNGKQDIYQQNIPVKNRFTPEYTSASGTVESVAEENIKLPQEIYKELGGLNLTLTPTLGMDALLKAKETIDYEYMCSEQTASKLIASLWALEVLKTAKVQIVGDLDANSLDQLNKYLINVLVNSQNLDGGWGWWGNYKSDDYLSAYVIESLQTASIMGYPVPPQVLEKGESYLYYTVLTGQRAAIPTIDNIRVYVAYVLSLNPKSIYSLDSFYNNAYLKRNQLSNESLAYLAMAMGNSSAGAGKVSRILDELTSMANKESNTAYWDERNDNYTYYTSSDLGVTAAMLELLVQENKRNPLIEDAVRYLTIASNSNQYVSTKTNTNIVRAIANYLLSTDISRLDYTYKVEINNNTLKEGTFKNSNLMSVDKVTKNMSELQVAADNLVKIYKSGKGPLNYNMQFEYYIPSSEVEEEDQGFTIVREIFDSDGKVVKEGKLKEGEVYYIRLTVVTPKNRNFVAIEDHLPAGVEAMNESLKNTRTLNAETPKGVTQVKQSEQYYGGYPSYGYGNQDPKDVKALYFDHKEYRDDKTAIFKDKMQKGLYEMVYSVRAVNTGTYNYPAAEVYEMYTPDVFGHSSGGIIEVVP